MPASLLESQYATLEPPSNALSVDVNGTPAETVDAILDGLRP
jgi:gluconate kinase